MNILLLFAPNTDIRSRYSILPNLRGAVYPLGVGYIARVLELGGHNVTFIDCQFPYNTTEVINRTIKDKKIDIVGISSSTPNSYKAYWLVKNVKKNFPALPIIFGGPHVAAIKSKIYQECPEVDFLVFGEGEETTKELVKTIQNKESLSKVRGIAYKINGKIKVNKQRPLIKDLDTIPYPAYHLSNLQEYKPKIGTFRVLPFANIITSRGCPYKCIFCGRIAWRHICRTRSVGNILGEIDILVRRYGVKEIAFFDDTFTLNRERIVKLCNGLIRKYPGLIWRCYSRVNHVDLELLKLMKRAGCYSIGYGIESGDDEILRIMRKGITTDLCRKAVKWAKQAGIEVRTYYMLNNLGDTRETIEKTINFSKELDSELADFGIAHPLPGSELREILPTLPRVKINKKLWDDWSALEGDYVSFTQNDLDEDFIKRAYFWANWGHYFRPNRIIKNIRIALSNKYLFLGGFAVLWNFLKFRAFRKY